MPWGDPGVTEQLLIQESSIPYPSASGGVGNLQLQKAGLLKRLRFYSQMQFDQTAGTAAPSKSVYGPLGAVLRRIRVEANGRVPLFDLSGLGAFMYNEIQNRDGSPWATPQAIAEINVAQAANLHAYTTPATGVVSYYAKYPFEFQFALPVNIRQMVTELGLWLLQNQAIDVNIEATFNAMYAAAASRDALYSAGTGVTGAPNLAGSKIEIERELYAIPVKTADMPNLAWAHQVIEFTQPWTGGIATFNIPRAGLLLRAAVLSLDSSGDPVSYADIRRMKYIYGSNETPITRPGWSLVEEFLLDYNRLPPAGLSLLDFYKWGDQGLKLVKNTEEISNLRIETEYIATAAGTQRVILDRLVPVVGR